jgi:hypothetical protein
VRRTSPEPNPTHSAGTSTATECRRLDCGDMWGRQGRSHRRQKLSAGCGGATGQDGRVTSFRDRLVATGRWAGNHPLRLVFVIAVPLICAVSSARTDGEWMARALFIAGGLSWSGVLLPSLVRHSVLPIAAATAALSGGLLSLIAADPHGSDPSNSGELGLTVWALLTAGSAALWAQWHNQAEQRRSEKQLLARIAELERHNHETRRRVLSKLSGVTGQAQRRTLRRPRRR